MFLYVCSTPYLTTLPSYMFYDFLRFSRRLYRILFSDWIDTSLKNPLRIFSLKGPSFSPLLKTSVTLVVQVSVSPFFQPSCVSFVVTSSNDFTHSHTSHRLLGCLLPRILYLPKDIGRFLHP